MDIDIRKIHISVRVDRADVAYLQRQAHLLPEGTVSLVIRTLIRQAREAEEASASQRKEPT